MAAVGAVRGDGMRGYLWPFSAMTKDQYGLDEAFAALPDSQCEIDAETLLLYERVYFHELDSRDRVIERMQIPIAMMLALYGAQAYLLSNSNYLPASAYLFGFAFCLGASILAGIVGGVSVFKVLTGHTYRLLPTLIDLESYRRNCANTFAASEGAQQYLDVWVKTSVVRDTARQLIVCASHNALQNTKRSGMSWAAHVSLMISGVTAAAAFLLFHIGDLKQEPVHAVEIVEMRQNREKPVTLVGSVSSKGEFFLTTRSGSSNE